MADLGIKTCRSCGVNQCESEYSMDSSRKDGLHPYCRTCRKKTHKQYFQNNRMSLSSKHRAYRRAHAKQTYEISRRSTTKYPEKYYARMKVKYAVQVGRLKKEPCMECGSTAFIDAHHDDYAKPLDVLWLCRPHHQQRHRLIKNGVTI